MKTTRVEKILLAELSRCEAQLELERPGTTNHQDLAMKIQNLSVYFSLPRPWREYRDTHGVIYRY